MCLQCTCRSADCVDDAPQQKGTGTADHGVLGQVFLIHSLNGTDIPGLFVTVTHGDMKAQNVLITGRWANSVDQVRFVQLSSILLSPQVTHGDMKAQNVLITGRWAKITDVGVARVMAAPEQSETIVTLGT